MTSDRDGELRRLTLALLVRVENGRRLALGDVSGEEVSLLCGSSRDGRYLY